MGNIPNDIVVETLTFYLIALKCTLDQYRKHVSTALVMARISCMGLNL
jgi:hypothetical protein